MLDAGPPQPCDSGTVTYTGLAEGPHTFSVTATDPAPFSNVDPTPAVRSFSFAAPDTAAPGLRLRGPKKQGSPKRILVKATCVDEACSLRATGRVKVKILRPNGKVRKTRKLKLETQTRSVVAGKTVRLRVKLNRKAKKLVRRSFRRKAARAVVKVRATDSAGNATSARRKVKVVRKQAV